MDETTAAIHIYDLAAMLAVQFLARNVLGFWGAVLFMVALLAAVGVLI